MYSLIKLSYFLFGSQNLNFLRNIGKFLGIVGWYTLPRRRHIAIINAKIIGAKDPVECAKNSFKHSFISYMESFYIQSIDEEFLEKHIKVTFKGPKPDFNKGEIIVSAHFGCWELAAPVFAMLSPLRIGLLARKIKNPNIDRFIKKQRGANGKIYYLYHRDSVQQIKQLIDSNSHIAALLDHASTERDSIFVPFFGMKTTFNRGLAVIAARKNILIRPTFLKRTEDGAELIFTEPIYPDKSLSPTERVYDIALKVNQRFEEVITETPEQWYLIHKRFKKFEDEHGKISRSFYR